MTASDVVAITARSADFFRFLEVPTTTFEGQTSLLEKFGARRVREGGQEVFLISGKDLPGYSLELVQDVATGQTRWKQKHFNAYFSFVITPQRVAMYSRQHGTLVVEGAVYPAGDVSRVASTVLWHNECPSFFFATLPDVNVLRRRGYVDMDVLIERQDNSAVVKMEACLQSFRQVVQFFTEWMCATIPPNTLSVFEGFTVLRGLQNSPGFGALLDNAHCALDGGATLKLVAVDGDLLRSDRVSGEVSATLMLDSATLTILGDLRDELDVLFDEDPCAKAVKQFLDLARAQSARVAVTY